MKEDVKVIVATHKKYSFPNDKMYMPIQVGAKLNEDLGYQKDSIGYNISEKNPYYCELTALYWAWKNLETDYLGLVHYRRYFSLKEKKYKEKRDKDQKDKMRLAITKKEVKKVLQETDVILP